MKFKRLAALLLAFLLLANSAVAFAENGPDPAEDPVDAAGAFLEKPDSYTVEGVTYPYLRQLANTEPVEESEMTLYFVNGGDIPYVSLEDYAAFLSELLAELNKGDIEYRVQAISDALFLISRDDNASTLYIDTEEDSLYFLNMNGFTQKVGSRAAVTIMDLPEVDLPDVEEMADLLRMFSDILGENSDIDLGADIDEASEEDFTDVPLPEDFEDMEDDSLDQEDAELFRLGGFGFYYNRAGDSVEFNMGDYMIDLVAVDGVCYIPFQTLNDLLLTKEYMQFVFTGEKVLGCAYGTALSETRFEAPTGTFSEEFALFNYNELRFLLDSCYGLKPEHNITEFGDLFAFDTGMLLDLTGTDPRKFDLALQELAWRYLDDGHSGYIGGSVLAGPSELDKYVTFLDLGPSGLSTVMAGDAFADARKAVYGDAVTGDEVYLYEEFGDTAFITFDSFTQKREDLAYYTDELDLENPQDTLELIMYANQQIKRENSPIKNIVIDLSNNGGGNASAAVFVLGWFLGDASVSLRDTLTGAQTNLSYNVDVDRDGAYDADKDSVSAGYNLYCMTSKHSFSCGNLVPAACKSSGKVTMVGQTSGGGSCVVLPCTTASGAFFQISGPFQLAIIKNGSFYNIDSGIDPDIVLTKAASFYDRAALADYLREVK